MDRQWEFVKYVGCGNDFILFDNRTEDFPINESTLSSLCHRQYGIGADGVILLEPSSVADFRMRIFNSDGGEAEMCGNGIRCLMRFLEHLGFQKPSYQISTLQRILTVAHDESNIKVEMGAPCDLKWDIGLSIENETVSAHHLDTGVPHAVLFVKNVKEINVTKMGPPIRFHPLFSPKGANVNFTEILDENTICVRTYERGVENETLSCGTGATAAALAAANRHGLKSPVYVQTTHSLKDPLKISFEVENQNFVNVHMTGPAHSTFRGIVNL
jgi:diaminopimelate epimerase